VIRALLLGLLVLGGPRLTAAQAQEKVIDLRGTTRAVAVDSFESLWAAYRRADKAGDRETAEKALSEIRRLRIERNIRSFETLSLALVGGGLDRLARSERDAAEEDFRRAMTLDPYLPDAQFGLALADLKQGPLGWLPALRHTLAGSTARLPTLRGEFYLSSLLLPVGLVAGLATIGVFALALVLRHGPLLQHDIEESVASGGLKPYAFGIYVALLLLPVITFQGYAWLPFWWLTLLFLYVGPVEKAVAGVALAATLAVEPAFSGFEDRALAFQNPLFRASAQAVEGGPDARASAALEKALRQIPDDRDLVYLLAVLYRKAGSYDDAVALYRVLLQTNKDDSLALNNLANIEFARGEFQAAIARYKAGTQITGIDAPIQATFFYNQSLAHLQRFEYQPATEARSQAERLDAGLIREYDRLWKYDKGDYAVVDLTLDPQQLWAKFGGVREGVTVKNLTSGESPPPARGILARLLNRFTAFLLVAGLTVFLLRRWRGPRMFTQRCLKCGTPFCKRCHLGAAAAGLCTQCYHLFVVRDGVSGPARNQKLLEVQKEDEHRERVFRVLSLVSPGAGHVYAQRTLPGLLFLAGWYLLLALAVFTGRLVPFTEASAAVSRPWPLALAALLLLALYVVANRARPDFEQATVPVPRRGAVRRARA
jgi:tetratricopeptide (TPR) repeat protein